MAETRTAFMLAAALLSTARAEQPAAILQLEAFTVCHRQGCAEQTDIRLSAEDATAIYQAFGGLAASPEQERLAITRAIARFEHSVGPRTGTDRDLGGTFPGVFRNGQMDCIDEATNTTTYLRLLKQAGLLQWHSILEPATRLPIPRNWWPHTSATIQDKITGVKYAVDSWFEANGQPPHIIELKQWRRGWKPSRDEQSP